MCYQGILGLHRRYVVWSIIVSGYFHLSMMKPTFMIVLQPQQADILWLVEMPSMEGLGANAILLSFNYLQYNQTNNSAERKLKLCSPCWKARHVRDSCRCTIRHRVLDRWLCLGCFQEECKAIKNIKKPQSKKGYANSDRSTTYTRCHCGGLFKNSSLRTICLWCEGEVQEPNN